MEPPTAVCTLVGGHDQLTACTNPSVMDSLYAACLLLHALRVLHVIADGCMESDEEMIVFLSGFWRAITGQPYLCFTWCISHVACRRQQPTLESTSLCPMMGALCSTLACFNFTGNWEQSMAQYLVYAVQIASSACSLHPDH